MPTFDVEALVRAVLIGIAVGCLMGALGYFVTRPDWPRRIQVLTMGGCGIGLLVGLVIYYGMPSRSTVPVLDNLSQTEAEDLLAKHKLIPSSRPHYMQGVPDGRVVPQSQSPASGLVVPHGSVVTFGVSLHSTEEVAHSPDDSLTSKATLSLFVPKDRGTLKCIRSPTGIARCDVWGALKKEVRGVELLLWVEPLDPPSETPGWYLQRPPANGLRRIEPDGAWNGAIQIGDSQYSAKEGDRLNVAVSIVSSNEGNRLLSQIGVVVRNQPQGSAVRMASRVVVTFK